ncbi:hypothetical protein M438DRAFT_146043 [Aureobasidium pullulans EXF-150]|uniref:Uncharacterized protein n=1 Tax=Aureobasidium pullulans EXF-150 TaxID=1043002 RepID=A0A074X2A3_AURPU|nr:uncharacterized protein M438DRAFT_146043 [Aureobasidium pullulans EXF-150]KEQ79538.1 hypothetical protein M438DRAFT_146043 [Aureobasidium pullulans EXF-150]
MSDESSQYNHSQWTALQISKASCLLTVTITLSLASSGVDCGGTNPHSHVRVESSSSVTQSRGIASGVSRM